MTFYYLFTVFLVYILSGTSTQAEPLIGENVTRVEKGKYSFVVSISLKNDRIDAEKMHICTGALITKKFVLTAAHCFDSVLLGEIQVIVGSVDLREGKKYDPSMWITYNEWAEEKNISKKYSTNDIAMLKLSHRVRNDLAKLIKFPSIIEKKDNLNHKYVSLVGWGLTNESPHYSPRYLHEAKVKVLPNSVCESISYDVSNMITSIGDKYLCTQGIPHVFLSNGDSGGPVLRENSIVAVSRGTCPKSGECHFPDDVINDYKYNVHSDVEFYKEFINDAEPITGENVNKVKKGNYLYVVSITRQKNRFYEKNTHFCTGALIAGKFVLTAAHCLDGESLNKTRLIVGSHDRLKGKKFKPSMWITYDQWAESKNITEQDDWNDVAIVKLTRPVDGNIAEPASLSFTEGIDLNHEYVSLVGWGATNESSNHPSRHLHKAKVKVLPNADCERYWYELFKTKLSIRSKYLCTKGQPNAFLANGDSGGPVLRQNSVVGINRSTCPGSGNCGFPEAVINNFKFNIHSIIGFYKDFIDDVLNNY